MCVLAFHLKPVSRIYAISLHFILSFLDIVDFDLHLIYLQLMYFYCLDVLLNM